MNLIGIISACFMQKQLYKILSILLFSLLIISFTSCSNSVDSHEQKKIIVPVYPLDFLVNNLISNCNKNIVVENLAQNGVEPHDIELSQTQVRDIKNSILTIYIKGFQSATDNAVAQELSAPNKNEKVLDISVKNNPNPHVWLNPVYMETVAQTASNAIQQNDVENAKCYKNNLKQVIKKLKEIDKKYKTFSKQYSKCKNALTIVTGHQAFYYLAKQYGWEQFSVGGIDPEIEPSLSRIKQIDELISKNNIKTIYYADSEDQKIMQTIARNTQTKLEQLNPIEIFSKESGNYYSLMEQNLKTVKNSCKLECTKNE